jgi:chromate transporter
MARVSQLWSIILLFSKLSLLAVGGVNSTLPAILRDVVYQHHWMNLQQFSQLFAIAQAAPGPNMLIVALIGEHQAGVIGGVAATIATVVPAGILVLLVSAVWDKFRHARWRRVLQAAILPITAGLVLSAGIFLVRAADTRIIFAAITLVAIALTLQSKIHPLWLLGGGALAGLIFN